MIPKFRVWDKTRNEMNYKVMVGNCDTDDENWTCPIIWIEEKKDWLHFDDYECIMQSTGLKDKNGKEIFEGDILGTKDGLLNGVVQYSSDLGMWIISLIRYNNFERLCNVATSREIIGNVWEDGDLIDDKKTSEN